MLVGDTKTWVYYLENNVISRALSDGTNPTALVQSSETGWTISNFDLDLVSNRIVYAETNWQTNSRIKSVDLLGQNPILISQGAAGNGNYSMAVDGVNHAVYLHSHDIPPLGPGPHFNGRIQKITYQGVLTLLPPTLWYVHDMEVDAEANTLYYSNSVNNDGLFKSDLNGNGSTRIVFDSDDMRNIAISRSRNQIIYSVAGETPNKSTIYRMNPDGTNKVKLGDYGGAGIDDIEIDDSSGTIYFATTLDGIFKTSIDSFAPILVMSGQKREIELFSVTNQPPTLAPINDLIVPENAAPQIVHLTGISAGGNETQPLRVSAISNNPSLMLNPSVTYVSGQSTGVLKFQPYKNKSGTAVVTVFVEDGGLDNNLSSKADNASFTRSFSVTINPINDPPVFDGNGSLTLSKTLTTSDAASMLIDDFDGNQFDDLAMTHWHDPSSVVIFKGSQGFAFPEPQIVGLSTQSYQIRSADMDGDGDHDLVVVNHGANSVYVLKNDGQGNFSIFNSFPLPHNVSGLAVGDFDLDGDQDVVVGTPHIGTWHILLNSGNGDLAVSQSYNFTNVTDMDSADFNNDGWLDSLCTHCGSIR